MQIIETRERMSAVVRQLRREENRTIGFVPTMGALHEGHLSLVREARTRCDVVIVSVFVNPAQFGPREDFKSYPRDLAGDARLLEESGVDYLFAPAVDQIYPSGFSTYITVEELSDRLEGASRPGHFRGVTTVVAILLNIVQPDAVFFGQKDAQQAIVIKRMVRDLAFPLEVAVVPTVREATGLAMSSRNSYLTAEERRAATVLHRALTQANVAFAEGERDAARLIEIVRTAVETEPRVRLDYVSVNDGESLQTLDQLDTRPALVSLAAFVGSTRLIDNVVLGREKRTAVSGDK